MPNRCNACSLAGSHILTESSKVLHRVPVEIKEAARKRLGAKKLKLCSGCARFHLGCCLPPGHDCCFTLRQYRRLFDRYSPKQMWYIQANGYFGCKPSPSQQHNSAVIPNDTDDIKQLKVENRKLRKLASKRKHQLEHSIKKDQVARLVTAAAKAQRRILGKLDQIHVMNQIKFMRHHMSRNLYCKSSKDIMATNLLLFGHVARIDVHTSSMYYLRNTNSLLRDNVVLKMYEKGLCNRRMGVHAKSPLALIKFQLLVKLLIDDSFDKSSNTLFLVHYLDASKRSKSVNCTNDYLSSLNIAEFPKKNDLILMSHIALGAEFNTFSVSCREKLKQELKNEDVQVTTSSQEIFNLQMQNLKHSYQNLKEFNPLTLTDGRSSAIWNSTLWSFLDIT